MDELRVMILDTLGFGRDVLIATVAEIPYVRVVAADPDLVVVDDRCFEQAEPFMQDGVPTVVVGADDDPGYAARARRHGALAWVPKESGDSLLPAVVGSALVAS